MKFGFSLRAATALLVFAALVGLTSSRADRRPNIVLVIVDTLRADAVGCYGSRDALTPNIDRLAAGGIRFERVVSQAPWTAPSIASILSSRYPSEHGEGARRVARGVDPASLAEILARRGYRTAAFVEVEWPYLRRGFQTFDNTIPDFRWRLRTERRGASITFGRAADWIAAHRDAPFFVLIHTAEVHDYFVGKDYARQFAARRLPGYKGPFRSWGINDLTGDTANTIIRALLQASPDDVRYVRALYDAGVQETDRVIGSFTGALGAAGVLDNTVLAITADHGEGFDPAARRLHHGGRLHDDLLHVPLVVTWAAHAVPAVVRPQVRSIDIAPTLLRFATPEKDPHFHGESVVQPEPTWTTWFAGATFQAAVPADRPALSEESALAVLPSGERVASDQYQLSLAVDGRKLIHEIGHDELYDLDKDPAEKANLIAQDGDVAATLREEMARLVLPLGSSQKTNPSEDLTNVLRSLGYIR